MFFGPIATSFAPFPFYPLHAPQAAPQKTSQICVLLLRVASLADFNDASDIICMTSWCIRRHLCNILIYLTWFGQHFSFFGDMLSWFLWKYDPRLGRKHNSEDRHEAFLNEKSPFFRFRAVFLGRFFAPLGYFGLLWKTNIFACRPHQAPSHTHHTRHLRSFGSIFHCQATSFRDFSENVLPA